MYKQIIRGLDFCWLECVITAISGSNVTEYECPAGAWVLCKMKWPLLRCIGGYIILWLSLIFFTTVASGLLWIYCIREYGVSCDNVLYLPFRCIFISKFSGISGNWSSISPCLPKIGRMFVECSDMYDDLMLSLQVASNWNIWNNLLNYSLKMQNVQFFIENFFGKFPMNGSPYLPKILVAKSNTFKFINKEHCF